MLHLAMRYGAISIVEYILDTIQPKITDFNTLLEPLQYASYFSDVFPILLKKVPTADHSLWSWYWTDIIIKMINDEDTDSDITLADFLNKIHPRVYNESFLNRLDHIEARDNTPLTREKLTLVREKAALHISKEHSYDVS